MDRKHGASDWLYLIASVVASYFLIQREREQGDEQASLEFMWSCVKMLRKIRKIVGRWEDRLMAHIDGELEKDRTV